MLLSIGTAAATAIDVPGDTANGVDVDVTRLPSLPAGSNDIGGVDVLTVPADQTVKLRGLHADTISSRKTGLQPQPVLDVRLVEDSLGGQIGQTAAYPLITATSAVGNQIYGFSTGEVTLAVGAGTQEILTIFKTAAVTEVVQLLELRWHPAGVPITAGRAAFGFQFITAEAATPGGTVITPQPMNRGNVLPANVTTRQVVTGVPTVTGQLFNRRPLLSFPNVTGTMPGISQPGSEDGQRIYDAAKQGAIVLRGGQAEGIRVSLNVVAALTGAQIGYIVGTLFIG